MGKVLGAAGLILVGGLSLAVVASILNGWALMHLWYWFVVPLGVRPLGVAQAIGLAMLIRILTNENPVREEKSLGMVIFLVLARPFVWLGIGALVARFMA